MTRGRGKAFFGGLLGGLAGALLAPRLRRPARAALPGQFIRTCCSGWNFQLARSNSPM